MYLPNQCTACTSFTNMCLKNNYKKNLMTNAKPKFTVPKVADEAVCKMTNYEPINTKMFALNKSAKTNQQRQLLRK